MRDKTSVSRGIRTRVSGVAAFLLASTAVMSGQALPPVRHSPFQEVTPQFSDVVAVEDVRLLQKSFRGWLDDELPERSPVMAVVRNGHAISICFCARHSHAAAEAGVETAAAFRGQGACDARDGGMGADH